MGGKNYKVHTTKNKYAHKQGHIVQLLINKTLGSECGILECEESDVENSDELSEYNVDLVLHNPMYAHSTISFVENAYKNNFPDLSAFLTDGYYLQLLQPPKYYTA